MFYLFHLLPVSGNLDGSTAGETPCSHGRSFMDLFNPPISSATIIRHVRASLDGLAFVQRKKKGSALPQQTGSWPKECVQLLQHFLLGRASISSTHGKVFGPFPQLCPSKALALTADPKKMDPYAMKAKSLSPLGS